MQRHADELVERGSSVVRSFLTPEEVSAANTGMLRYFPSAEELAATPLRYEFIFDDPEHLQIEFPFASDTLNGLATHPEIISFVERLLGTREVLLSQSAIWAKYAGTGSFEQEMHLDYEGNTLVVPRDEGLFRQVNLILYYSDVTEDLGPTCVVPREFTRELSPWPPFRPRKKYPELYRKEEPVLAKAGDLLLFSMGTFHRASEMIADLGVRFTHHLVYRAAAYPFAGFHQWSRFGEKPEMKRFIEQASPRQREVIGFPAPGHPYWNEHTLTGAAARYPKMDLTPYRQT